VTRFLVTGLVYFPEIADVVWRGRVFREPPVCTGRAIHVKTVVRGMFDQRNGLSALDADEAGPLEFLWQ
jgi:hypothetical protein